MVFRDNETIGKKMNVKFKENNLDLLRLILATSVIFLHLKHLTGVDQLNDFFSNFDFLSVNAVPAFFVVSGFLIFMSFDKSRSISSYFTNRFLRIYPAYFVLILLCIVISFLIAPVIDVDFSKKITAYFFSNIVFLNFLHPTLPGLFENNPVSVVNGALWTLKVEVMFYLSIPFIYYLVKRYNPVLILFFIYFSSYIYYILLTNFNLIPNYNAFLAHQLPAQMVYFTSGILFYLYFNVLMSKKYYLLLFSFFVFFFQLDFFTPLALGFIIFYFFMYLPKFSNLSRVGDMSYGVYIYHFPVIQLLTQFNLFEKYPFVASFFVFVFTFLLAFFSWHLIEKNALKLKEKFRRNTIE